jgi:gamma-glutamylcyclotransferase
VPLPRSDEARAGIAGRVLYFAYGSNMDPDTFGRRRGIAWSRAVPGLVRGWRLAVDKPSLMGTGEAMATLVPDDAGEVHGVLYEIAEDDYTHLELTEGVLIGHYSRAEVAFIPLSGGDAIAACTLVSDRRDTAIRPTTRYMKLLVAGAREHGLPEKWIAVLESIEAVEETAEHAALRPFFDRGMARNPDEG